MQSTMHVCMYVCVCVGVTACRDSHGGGIILPFPYLMSILGLLSSKIRFISSLDLVVIQSHLLFMMQFKPYVKMGQFNTVVTVTDAVYHVFFCCCTCCSSYGKRV